MVHGTFRFALVLSFFGGFIFYGSYRDLRRDLHGIPLSNNSNLMMVYLDDHRVLDHFWKEVEKGSKSCDLQSTRIFRFTLRTAVVDLTLVHKPS